MSSAAPPPPAPGDGPGSRFGKDPATGGCMRWGLVGCAALSVLAIVGMVLFMRKAPQLMESLLGATEAQVVAAIAGEVPEADRRAFRMEYAAFVATAKAGEAKPDEIQAVQRKIVDALRDNRVDSAELRGITEQLRAVKKK
ncbi:MAG: hypothetical protein U0529_06805 [Thermoanaerobaculia bacterium]